MDILVKQLRLLLDESHSYTYQSLPKSEYGYPTQVPANFKRWAFRCEEVIGGSFLPTSSIIRLVESAIRGIPSIKGNGSDKFEYVKSQLIAALEAAISAVGDDIFAELKKLQSGNISQPYSSRIFIVHGHDHKEKNELELFLREIGLDVVVLHREADEGKTIIEKFLHNSDVGYAVVLATPDDKKNDGSFSPRPNVIFEWGYFLGTLGRERVCCLYKKGTELPSDLSGLIYKSFNETIEEVKYALVKELRAAGYAV